MTKTYTVAPVALRISRAELGQYLQTQILPYYRNLDTGHDLNHIYNVLRNAYQVNDLLPKKTKQDLLTTAVVYHDLGITGTDEQGRGQHHLLSAQKVRADKKLRQWLNEKEITAVAVACEQHRASFRGKRRSLLAKIVADADTMDAFNFERTLVYVNHDWLPAGSPEEKIKLMYQHYLEKFSPQGYAKFELPEARALTREFRQNLVKIGASFTSYRDFFLTHYREWL